MKKFFYVMAAALFISASGRVSTETFAATISDSASDDTVGTANAMSMGDTISGTITETDDLDYYRFQLDRAGCVTLNMTAYMQYYCIKIFNADGEELWYTAYNEWIETVGYRSDAYSIYLEQGTYYMEVNGYRRGDDDKSTGSYECRTSFISSGVNNVEVDNSFQTANMVSLGNTLIGQISEGDDLDTYKFTLSGAGCVSLDMTSYMQYYCIKVFDSDGEELWYTAYNEWTDTVGYRNDKYSLYLDKGTYYMQVNGYRRGDDDKSTGRYVLKTGFSLTNETFAGNDNSIASANSIAWNKKYTGQISLNDDYDTYKFSVSPSKTVVINITSYMKYYCIKIYKPDGKEIWYTDGNEWNENVGYRKDAHNIVLSAGTYYMQINGYRWSDYDKSTGKYVFSLTGLTQSNCSHDYKVTDVDATYFSKGYTLHKCSKCKKTYRDSYTSKRVLGQGYLSTYSSYGGKKKLVLSWSTVTDASGYQIKYTTDKSMKASVKVISVKGGSKYKKTIKYLKKKKKYYVKIRAYKTSGASTVYGKWSAKLKLKTR